jgi:trans-aconitate methyltransferase/nucleoside-diphosphate-sugar epimerase
VTWDPDRYLRFADQRTRPGLELLARIPDLQPRRVVDLGSGTGHLTALLAARWPDASIIGIDHSSEMIERARSDHPELTWVHGDVGSWQPDEPVDLIFSNATLHWLDDHEQLFRRLRTLVDNEGVVAVQMPDNWSEPTHRIPAEILDEADWPEVARSALTRDRLSEPAAYAAWLQPAGVDPWRTTYYQRLTGDDPVWTWVTGSVLSPHSRGSTGIGSASSAGHGMPRRTPRSPTEPPSCRSAGCSSSLERPECGSLGGPGWAGSPGPYHGDMTVHRIVVTGGAGKAGIAVVADLADHGYEVVSVDAAESRHPDQPTLVADLTDLGQTIESLRGFDAAIHLAAIPAPNVLPEGETFRINTMSTYNVFTAATQLGLQRVVWASSETLIGLPFHREQPSYAPIDEEHPLLPESHYALSKLAGEAIAAQVHRWSGIPFVALRISNIMNEIDYVERFPGFWDDATIRAWNLWGYVDARDVAQAARLALTAGVEGAEAFLVAAADTCMTRPSMDLMAEVYPQVPMRHEVAGHDTLLAIDKARALLGYEPGHSWRDHLDAP